MAKAKTYTMSRKKPEPALQELGKGNANFYRILKENQETLLALDDQQLGRVMRTIIENNGEYYMDSEEENNAYAGLLLNVIMEII